MSEAFDKGRDYERHIRKVTSSILKINVQRDSKSGAGIHKQDVRDQFGLLPIFIECKDQNALSVKAEWRVTDRKSGHGQAPLVVFPDDEEDLCVMRYADLLQFIREAWDYRDTAEDLRRPAVTTVGVDIPAPRSCDGACAAGHITDSYGYCSTKGCKFSRGYRAPKVKK